MLTTINPYRSLILGVDGYPGRIVVLSLIDEHVCGVSFPNYYDGEWPIADGADYVCVIVLTVLMID